MTQWYPSTQTMLYGLTQWHRFQPADPYRMTQRDLYPLAELYYGMAQRYLFLPTELYGITQHQQFLLAG